MSQAARSSVCRTDTAAGRNEVFMFAIYITVTVLAAAANIYAATNDFTRPEWLLANMTKLGVSESLLPMLGTLKALGAVGLLVGIGVPSIGTTAAIGLVLFFIGAIVIHLRHTTTRSVLPSYFFCWPRSRWCSDCMPRDRPRRR